MTPFVSYATATAAAAAIGVGEDDLDTARLRKLATANNIELSDAQLASICVNSADDQWDHGWLAIMRAVAAGKLVEFNDDGDFQIDGKPYDRSSAGAVSGPLLG